VTPRGLVLLLGLGVIALVGGWYFGTARTPGEQTRIDPGQLMFPDLGQHLGEAAKVEITHQGKQTAIEKRADGAWGVASVSDYPAKDAKLRGLLIGLTELRLAEARTTDPAQFGRLGVDDPGAAGSSADLLRLVNGAGSPVLSMIVGHRRVRGRGEVPDQLYVRRPGDDQVWLAEGSLQVDADPAQWLDRDVLSISHERIASVAVTHAAGDAGSANEGSGGQTLGFERAGGRWALTSPADHPKLDDGKIDDVGRALELLTFQAVRAERDVAASEAGRAVFTTSDGLVVAVTVLHADKDMWTRFAVTGTEAVKPEVDRLTRRLSGWVYQVGAWKEKALVPTLDDLRAAEPAKAEAGAASDPGAATDPDSGRK